MTRQEIRKSIIGCAAELKHVPSLEELLKMTLRPARCQRCAQSAAAFCPAASLSLRMVSCLIFSKDRRPTFRDCGIGVFGEELLNGGGQVF